MAKDSGGSNQQTTTSKVQLPKATEALLNRSSTQAMKLFDKGVMFRPYEGSTVVPFDRNTTTSQNMSLAAAKQAQPGLTSAFNGISGIASGTGYNSAQNDAMARMKAIAGNASGSNSESNLAAYANGSMIGRGNPAFDAVLERSQSDAQNAVNMGAAAAGRYGSGVHQGNVAREIGDLTNRALSTQYNQDLDRMFNANTAMDAQRLANLGIQGQMAGDLFNAGQRGQTNRMSAAGMLPAAYQATLAPAQTYAGVGAQMEDLATRQMNDKLRLHNEKASQSRQAIEWLNAIATGSGSLGASTTQSVAAPKQNPFMSGLGGAAAGFGMGGPTGALLGGGLGLLGGFF